MKHLTRSIALVLFLFPLAALAQQTQVSTATKPVADSAYYIHHVVFKPVYLCKGEEKMPMLNSRGLVLPEIKAQFEPYPNAYREILLSERHTRKTNLWLWGTLGVGTASVIYALATRRNGEYNYGIDLAGSVIVLGTAATTLYHAGNTIKSRRKAVDYLNARQ